MAKTIQVRDVPDEIHRSLRVRAAAAGRSLSDYVLDELVRVAERPPPSPTCSSERRGRYGGTPTKHIVSAVRSGRDRRMA